MSLNNKVNQVKLWNNSKKGYACVITIEQLCFSYTSVCTYLSHKATTST